MNFKNTLLFTGAGFTANFGGFLVNEMWSKIFNNPRLNEAGNLKLELKNSFDFEEIYSNVINNKTQLHPYERQVFVDSLNEAYLAMDSVIKQLEWEQTYGIHSSDLRRFLDYFRESDEGKMGVCFTLNQDLFLERHFDWQPLGPSEMRYKNHFGKLDINDINSNIPKKLPNTDELETYKNSLSRSFCYIKLHGSQGWVASDGKDTKVLGINKREVIERIPLLKWYFGLFEQALFRENVKLVVIGYSFRDDHINKCITKAVNEYRLKIYIISPEDPQEFYFRLTNKYPSGTPINEENEEGRRIWNAIDGYFTYKLKDIFPISQRFSAERVEIFKAIGISL